MIDHWRSMNAHRQSLVDHWSINDRSYVQWLRKKIQWFFVIKYRFYHQWFLDDQWLFNDRSLTIIGNHWFFLYEIIFFTVTEFDRFKKKITEMSFISMTEVIDRSPKSLIDHYGHWSIIKAIDRSLQSLIDHYWSLGSLINHWLIIRVIDPALIDHYGH